jgi:hypothetical protein
MGKKINQFLRRKQAHKDLSALFGDAKNVVVIHYSCESFYDRQDGSSPRVTSIAVRNLASGLTKSFSIHQMAEKRKVAAGQIVTHFNELEKRMLKEFFDYAKTHQRGKWLHWNMRDINYGFAALEHRFQVLGGIPVAMLEENLHDLSRILISLYGVGYIGHPRLEKLMEKNAITPKDFLVGGEEAKAFESGEYVKLHQSTLRKVDVLANMAERAENGTLLTNATWWEMHGGTLAAISEWLREHWIVSGVTTTCTVAAGIYKLSPLVALFGGG